MTKVLINGLFLTQRPTAAQRYACETLRALDDLLAAPGRPNDLHFAVIAPRNAPRLPLKNIDMAYTGCVGGYAWEQLTLPYYARGSVLLNLCPTGPLLCRNQVVTMHDTTVFTMPEALHWHERIWQRWFLPGLARRACYLVAVSQATKWNLVAHYGTDAEQIHVSGEGWDHVIGVHPDPSVLTRHNLHGQDYVLLRVDMQGTRSPDMQLALAIATTLEHQALKLAVVGAVDKRTSERIQAQAPAIELVGDVSDEALRSLYEHAVAFVDSAGLEGQEGSEQGLLEALAYHCPVVTARSANNRETCGEAALYYHPHDPAGLVRILVRLQRDRTLGASLVAKGQEVLRQCTWKAAALRHLAALNYHCRPRRTPRSMPPMPPLGTPNGGGALRPSLVPPLSRPSNKPPRPLNRGHHRLPS